MQPAGKINLDADTSVIFKVKRSVVWDLVKDPSQWNRIHGESISAFDAESESSCKMVYGIKIVSSGPVKSELQSQLKRDMRTFIGGIVEKTGSLE